VHMTGGVAAFWGAFFCGMRRDTTETKDPYAAVFRTLGVLILWTGWYGFNAVSTLYIVGYGLVAAKTMVTTTLAAGAGAVSTMFLDYATNGGKAISLNMANNGVLAGLVAITSPCSTCDAYGAIIIGIGAAPVYLLADKMLKALKIDDVVGAAPVHGFCGAYGVLMAAVFATPANYANAYYSARAEKCAGIFYGGDGSSLAAGFMFICFVLAWTSFFSCAIFGTLNFLQLLRAKPEVEELGMDASEHGVQPSTGITSTSAKAPEDTI
jgi:Amt family ammonium transporter